MAAFLLALFVSYQCCIHFFGHAHIVNGAMIVHSHPFSTQTHTHTDGQIVTLANLMEFSGTEPLVFWLDKPILDEAKRNTTCLQQADCFRGVHIGFGLRAPPCS